MKNNKVDMSATCGHRDYEVSSQAGEQITYEEAEKWFDDNCGKCIWSSDICMHGETPDGN